MAEYRRTASTDSENEEISVALSQISSTRRKRTRKSTIKPSGKRLPSAPRTIPLDSNDEEELGPNDSGNEQEEEMLFIPGINLPTEFEYSVCASETAESESEMISEDSELSSVRIQKDNEKLRAALAAKGREVNRLLEKQKEIIAEQVANENMNSVKLKELEEDLNEKLDRDIISRDKEINKLKKLNEKLQKEANEKARIIKDLKDKIKEGENKNKENTEPQKGVKTVCAKAVPAQSAVVSSVASAETHKEYENVQKQRPHRLAVQRKYPTEYSEDKRPKTPMVSVEYLPCQVTSCKELFSNEKLRSGHMTAKHKIFTQQKAVTCDYCQKTFKNHYGLSGHMKVHKSIKRKADDAFSSMEQVMTNPNNKKSKSSRR